MSAGVRRDPLRDECRLPNPPHEAVDGLVREWRRFGIPTFPEGEEERPGRGGLARSFREKLRQVVLERLMIIKDCFHHVAGQGNATVLLALSDHVDDGLVAIGSEVLEAEAAHLGLPEAAAEHKE